MTEGDGKWSRRRVILFCAGLTFGSAFTGISLAQYLGYLDDAVDSFPSEEFVLAVSNGTKAPYQVLNIPIKSGLNLKAWLMKAPTSEEAGNAVSTEATPAETNDSGAETSDGGAIPAVVSDGNGAVTKFKNSTDAPTVIYLHGDRKDLGWSLPYMTQLRDQLNCNVLGIFYRDQGGINRSKEKVLAARGDVISALKWIHANATEAGINKDRIFLYGEGIGADIAANAANASPQVVRGLLLENPRETLPMQKYRFKNWNFWSKLSPAWVTQLVTTHHPSLYSNAAKNRKPIAIFSDERFSERVSQNVFCHSRAQDKWLCLPFSKAAESNPSTAAAVHQKWRNVLREFIDLTLDSKERPHVQVRLGGSLTNEKNAS
eukprot:Protomagalhaensia_sp_Gyna_25__1524@NODE_1783_length_1540_cov_204_671552_g1462_i0_p1_GENE_NODE_1783_length_1540_cov_204_671552_g1462_i0NODE_1783_length_1540_cov_204_671552_g1462_i0_p1_ORF_typecomplete_len374_score80_29Abhydrolase_3/PF07859_13/2_9e10Hydrolase_4/PF12146_8/6_7e10DUF818/PF05677_12/5_5e08DUF818/PF05677_12/1_3e03COesterase/PF00135_28/1_7e05DUF1057/PF06342_12/8_4e05Ndr/PF03096_14/0_00041Peptidase_S9/PF00326_21/0_0019Lipase/PF00151_19/0_0097Abhydrolase_6/PF12697_7/0_024Chlorophyllase2/PF